MITELTTYQIQKLNDFIKEHPHVVKVRFVTNTRTGIGVTVFAIGESDAGNTIEIDITDYSTW